MTRWPVFGMFLAAIIAGGVSAYARHQEQQRPVPSWAGEICDATWNKTRTTEPTVGWYGACVREVAKLHKQNKK